MIPNTYASLDIWDFYTKLVIRSYNGEKLDILFAKKAPTKGVVNGEVVSKGEANATINYLLREADKYGLPVDEVILVLPNKSLNVYRKKANIVLPYNSSKQITNAEIAQLRDACMKHKIQPNDIVIGIEDILYSLDGRSYDKKPPIGYNGNSISLDAYVYTIKEDIVNELSDLLDDVHVKIKKVVINSVACATAFLTEEEISRGAYIVDIGATTNNISFFKDGLLSDFKEGKLGGNYISYYMSQLLEISSEEAEECKVKYGNAKQDNTSNIVLFNASNGKKLTERMIATAIEEAVDNIIKDINHTKELMLIDNADNYPMLIVGGTSSIYNLEDKLQKDITNKVIVRHKTTFGARNNVYIAAVGAVNNYLKHFQKGVIIDGWNND